MELKDIQKKVVDFTIDLAELEGEPLEMLKEENGIELNIYEDLDLASLDVTEILLHCEEYFGIRIDDDEAVSIRTLRQLSEMIQLKIRSREMGFDLTRVI